VRQAGSLFDIWAADSRMFVSGNVLEGDETASADNRSAVRFKAGNNASGTQPIGDATTCLVAQPFEVAPVTTDSADVAYRRGLEEAGATRPKRDAVDLRIIDQVRRRTGKIINSPDDVGGWPELKSTPAPVDADHDGMPDAWEKARSLDPADPKDSAAISTTGYTNLEDYLNELAGSLVPPSPGGE
jgi:hypothetical protein